MTTRVRKTKVSQSQRKAARRRTVKIDPIDLRDRRYMPSVLTAPPAQLLPDREIVVLHQKETSACTGFALASTVHYLQAKSGSYQRVSPFMIYSMARRYDEFPGSVADDGSSLRGALKGWSRHGICHDKLWKTLKMPAVPDDPREDWWSDAMRRPLGAYYRIDIKSIADMHVALNEVGVLYASAICHAGWDEGDNVDVPAGRYWQIPYEKAGPADGGHAFIIVGYTYEGFIIQNSWGPEWATGGRAILRYEDWRAHAMDCWVVQLGAATALHLAIAESSSLRMSGAKVQLAQDEKLRNHELSPYIVNMENNGELSRSGEFRTSEGDLESLVSTYLERAREQWGLRANAPVDIAVYAHGGLTDERKAAEAAARWIPALYEQRIFPIFLMWETGLIATLGNMVKDWFGDEPKKTAGVGDWWNERLERSLAKPGTAVWNEMKENAGAIGTNASGGGSLLYHAAMKSKAFKPSRDRIHLIGHSAGGIVHAHLADTLAKKRWHLHSLNFMAPAAEVALFDSKIRPHLQSGRIARYNQWHLSDPLELKDDSCSRILGYGRSLLYLVSESFEGGKRTPILGMQKYAKALTGLRDAKIYAAQSRETNSNSHSGFDEDDATLQSVIRQIKAAA